MRLVETTKCRPGMILARNIYNETGITLLGQGMELTQTILDRLLHHGIHSIYIHDERTSDIVAIEPISEETRIKALKEIRSQFKKMMYDNVRKQGDSSIRMGKEFKDLLNSIFDEMSQHRDTMVMITDMCLTDNYLFNHSLNVCLYSTLLGMGMGMSRDELMVLGLGSILHDIGKMKMPPEILFKPGKLTDDEHTTIQRHAEIGYAMLKDLPNIPLIAAHCAFQHHERIDGSGYPRGIVGNDIHQYAKIIAIADVYDALTTHRIYRKAKLPHDAMELLYASAGTKFDKSLIELFFQKIAIYPLGMTVQLSTGETGVVVDLNASCLHRPIIRVLENESGEALVEPYEIDLSKHLTIMIDTADRNSDEVKGESNDYDLLN